MFITYYSPVSIKIIFTIFTTYYLFADQGSSKIEPGQTPRQNMTLSFYTWSEFEKNCGYSRLYGGVNFPDAVANIRYSTVILEKKMKLFTKFGKY